MADKRKRRSLRIFHHRSSTSDEGSLLSQTPSPIEYRASEQPDGSPSTTGDGSSPAIRPRVLTKPQRNSVFGSLRSLHSLDEDEKYLTKTESKGSSIHGDGDSPAKGLFGDHVKRA